MGVIACNQTAVSDAVNQVFDLISDLNIGEENAPVLSIEQKLPKLKSRRPAKPESSRPLQFRPKSARKRRRFEDVISIRIESKFRSPCKIDKRRFFIISASELYEKADSQDLGELTIDHFVSTNTSTFTQLFLEREKMNVWNNFIECSDEDQYKVLSSTNNDNVKHQDFIEELGFSVQCELNLSYDHPAYSPVSCFYKIDKDLRNLLKRRVSIGLVEDLEETIISFFTKFPTASYDCHLTDSFSRLMLHAISQYHNLHCKSYDQQGARRTQVKNKCDEWVSSQISMSTFLKKYFKRCFS
ncbi:R3H domain-containing protein 4 [Nymphon striatum]|nr:R3H domain-containing protein 4 [Nymphon striatum]